MTSKTSNSNVFNCKRGKTIGIGVHIHIYIYIRLWTKKKCFHRTLAIDSLFQTNIRGRTSRQMYRLALLLLSPETLSSLSKIRIFIFNSHLLYLSEG